MVPDEFLAVCRGRGLLATRDSGPPAGVSVKLTWPEGAPVIHRDGSPVAKEAWIIDPRDENPGDDGGWLVLAFTPASREGFLEDNVGLEPSLERALDAVLELIGMPEQTTG